MIIDFISIGCNMYSIPVQGEDTSSEGTEDIVDDVQVDDILSKIILSLL